jgi:lipoprotein-anchoring transpeptidase ErfK/SrfK
VKREAVVLLAIPLLGAACGSRTEAVRVSADRHVSATPVAVKVRAARACPTGVQPLGSARRAYVGVAPAGAVADRTPGGVEVARFGPKNVNGYPTVFGIVGVVHSSTCSPLWYRVQLPIRPNGSTGYVSASSLHVLSVGSRIVVDVSDRRLTLFEAGRVRLTATVAVGSAATPTPTGSYYVDQRLVPTDTSGPYGPGAVGISAHSDVLTGWTQGGPIAIHGTNEPWSIGRAVSNGCIRLPNATLRKVFQLALAGTPVIVRA